MSITDEKDKKVYNDQRKKQVMHVRFNPKEIALLKKMMKDEGWNNTSGFIKYKLFGLEEEEQYETLLKSKKPEDIGIVIAEGLRGLNIFLTYINHRYEKDMQQLWREEGVDVRRWENNTRKWLIRATLLLKDILYACKKIAETNKIELIFRSGRPKDEKIDYSDKKQMDAIAKELWQELQINDTRD